MIRVSAVIPTHNRKNDLEVCLEALFAQTYPADRFEVLVADDGSSDGTEQLAGQFGSRPGPAVKWLHQPCKGPAAARNLGIRNARGELVAMTDDDCRPEPDWLRSLSDAMEAHPEWAGCGGSIVRRNDSRISRYIDVSQTMCQPVSDGVVHYLITANAIYRKPVLDEVGGFEEAISWPGGEDPELSFRVRDRGYQLGLEPAAVISHKHRDTIKGLYRMFWNHGRGNAACYQLGRLPLENWDLKSTLERCDNALVGYLRCKDLAFLDRCAFAVCDIVRIWAFRSGRQCSLAGPFNGPRLAGDTFHAS